jgi:hypothetical protein
MGDGDEIDMRQQPPAVDLIPLPDTSTLGSTGTQTAA